MLFYLKCTRSSTLTINPHKTVNRIVFFVIYSPSRPFLLWTLYGNWHLTFVMMLAWGGRFTSEGGGNELYSGNPTNGTYAVVLNEYDVSSVVI